MKYLLNGQKKGIFFAKAYGIIDTLAQAFTKKVCMMDAWHILSVYLRLVGVELAIIKDCKLNLIDSKRLANTTLCKTTSKMASASTVL